MSGLSTQGLPCPQTRGCRNGHGRPYVDKSISARESVFKSALLLNPHALRRGKNRQSAVPETLAFE